MSATGTPGRKEPAIPASASLPAAAGQDVTGAGRDARRPCICQEDDGGPCGCDVPITREQVSRLRAFAARHPERAFIFSEITGEWMSALRAFLPSGADDAGRAAAWMADPFGLPPDAGLRHAADLGALLDMVGGSCGFFIPGAPDGRGTGDVLARKGAKGDHAS